MADRIEKGLMFAFCLFYFGILALLAIPIALAGIGVKVWEKAKDRSGV